MTKDNKYELVLDPGDQVIDQAEFEFQDWNSSNFGHISGNDYLSHIMPYTCGLIFGVAARVDADHSR